MSEPPPLPPSSRERRQELKIGGAAIDANRHANYVAYVGRIQEAAVAHANAARCTAATTSAAAIRVQRSLHVVYRRAVVPGTWVRVVTSAHGVGRAFSLRKCGF